MTIDTNAAPPRLWLADRPWEYNFPKLETWWDQANNEMNRMRGTTSQPIVDELALLFPQHGQEILFAFIEDAVSRGWCYFNNSVDTVRAEPMGAVYGVSYNFLRHPEKPWRLELMRKTGGVSPLHDTLLNASHGNGFPLVHASFKPMYGENENNYVGEQVGLEENGYLLAQACRSRYGAFSYWRKPDSTDAFFLKPRINTRDGAM